MSDRKEYKKFFKVEVEERKFDRKCKYCGWTNRILNKYHRIPCKNCGNMVFLSKKDEFVYRLGAKL